MFTGVERIIDFHNEFGLNVTITGSYVKIPPVNFREKTSIQNLLKQNSIQHYDVPERKIIKILIRGLPDSPMPKKKHLAAANLMSSKYSNE